VKISRDTARVLPVDTDGRVLLLLGQGLVVRRERYWLSVGGGVERGETLVQAAVRELHEETGIAVDPAGLGHPVGTTRIEFSSFGLLPVSQRQTYFAVAVRDTAVSFGGQGAVERRTIAGHAWLSAEDLEKRPERFSDPELPRLMRAGVAAVRGARAG
jgi:8-oxo-dGTP pyrophosphatase MutT (NUDIX family)